MLLFELGKFLLVNQVLTLSNNTAAIIIVRSELASEILGRSAVEKIAIPSVLFIMIIYFVDIKFTFKDKDIEIVSLLLLTFSS